MAAYTQYKNLELPITPDKYNIEVFNKNNSVIDSELHKLDLKNESQDKLLSTKEELNAHISDKNNPHEVTKSQIGLGNADNTSDRDKPVSTAQQNALDAVLYQSNYYTDTKIAELIDGAPESLNTLKELSEALAENGTVVEAINQTIGTKASQEELDTHIENDVIHVTQPDKDGWNAAREHADSAHARTDATKAEKSDTNGNIKINGTEINVYIHPDGTNPHGTTKSDVGLGNVENKSSAVIRGELTKENVTAALGYTPPAANTTYDVVSTSANGLCPKRTGTTTKFLRDDGTWAVPESNGGIDYSDAEPATLSTGMTWIGN